MNKSIIETSGYIVIAVISGLLAARFYMSRNKVLKNKK